MLPLRIHSSSTRWSASILLVVAMMVVHYLATNHPLYSSRWIEAYGLVPLRWWSESAWHTLGPLRQLSSLLTYAYLHDDWSHCLFNLWWLMVFGPVVHARFGSIALFMIYTCAGIAGGVVYILVSPDSLSPLVGASANISGVLGGYWVGCREHGVSVLGIGKPLHGGRFMALFLIVQIVLALLYTHHNVGVAFVSHVIGCVVGVLVALSYSRDDGDSENLMMVQ
jgi:membrane associated rhomboid family serine protease